MAGAVRGSVRARRKFDPAPRPSATRSATLSHEVGARRAVLFPSAWHDEAEMSIAHGDVGTHQVLARVVGRFPPVPADEWKRMDNNAKAKLGKSRFLGLEGALDATSERVRRWLAEHGLAAARREWVEVVVAPDLPPRYVNLAYTARCIDALIRRGGELEGCELKVSGNDGVCGLTVNEERLLRAGLIHIYVVNPVRGLIGEFLAVPRRVDGIPVGQASVEWQVEP